MTRHDDHPMAFLRRPALRIALGLVGLVFFVAMILVVVGDGSWGLAVFFGLLAVLGAAALAVGLRRP